MQREDMVSLLGEDADEFENIAELSDIDKLALLNRISLKVNKVSKVDDICFSYLIKGDSNFIAYKFRYKGNLYKAAFKCDKESNIDKILDVLLDIDDGLDAIETINTRLSKNINKTDIRLRWGKSAIDNIVNWDYRSVDIRVNDNTLNIILNEYRKGTNKFLSWVDAICDTPIESDLVGILKRQDDIEVLNKLEVILKIPNVEEELIKCLIDRKTAIKIMTESKDSLSKQTLRSAEIIHGLGRFLAIVVWKIDYKLKQVNNYLLDGHVLDLETFKVITNHELCSRIENMITIKEFEKGLILGE